MKTPNPGAGYFFWGVEIFHREARFSIQEYPISILRETILA